VPEHAGEKTFDATPHRRQEARGKGQVAFSQDVGSAALLLAAVLLIKWFGLNLLDFFAKLLSRSLGDVGSLVASRENIVHESLGTAVGLAAVTLPLLGSLAVAGVLSNVLQTGLLFVPERLAPDWSRLNPMHGLQRIFSLAGVMRLGFGLFKIVVIITVSAGVLWSERMAILNCGSLELELLGAFLLRLSLDTALWVAGALLVLALFDYAFQRWKYEQDLRMTHQEVREEMKNLQGDPQIVARRRQIQRQLALSRLGDLVPKADVVVTNPTELAVAIQYVPEEMAAPIVLAKGAGVLAQRIRRLALEHNIPIVERKPLAQLLYKEVVVNHPIPDKSYATVAEVLAYVYQLKGKKLPNMGRAA
jgi:flagellar biosynthetic protein FlhB